MDGLLRHQLAKVLRIGRDDDQVILNAASEYGVVALTHATMIARVDDDLCAATIEFVDKPWREALVEK